MNHWCLSNCMSSESLDDCGCSDLMWNQVVCGIGSPFVVICGPWSCLCDDDSSLFPTVPYLCGFALSPCDHSDFLLSSCYVFIFTGALIESWCLCYSVHFMEASNEYDCRSGFTYSFPLFTITGYDIWVVDDLDNGQACSELLCDVSFAKLGVFRKYIDVVILSWTTIISLYIWMSASWFPEKILWPHMLDMW